MKEKIYKLTESELRSLIEDSEFLDCLLNEGVDNWQGFKEAYHSFNEIKEDGYIDEILDDYIFEEVEHEDLDPSVELNVLEC
jgi:hypothetical protein